MSKIETINNFINSLPSEYLSDYIVFNNKLMKFFHFIGRELPKYCGDSVKVEDLKDLLKEHIDLYSYDEAKGLYVDFRLINSGLNYDERIDFYERAMNMMGDDFKIQYGDNLISLEEFLNKYKKQREIGVVKEEILTIQEKRTICEDLFNCYVPNELKDIILPNGDTLRNIIMEVYPVNMIDGETVRIKDAELSIMDALAVVLDYAKKIYDEKEEKAKAQFEKVNHVGDKPSFVSEINLEYDNENRLSVTSSIPVINEEVNVEEVAQIEDSSNVDDRLNELKNSIWKVNDNNLLDSYEFTFREIKGLSSNEDLVASIEEIIDAKRKNIIKIDANREEYADAMAGTLLTSINDGDLIKIASEASNKGIDDHSVKAGIERAKSERVENTLVMDGTPIDRDAVMYRSELDALYYQLKMVENNVNTSDYVHATGAQEAYNNLYDRYISMIENAPLSEEEKLAYYDKVEIKNNGRVAA